MLAFAALLGVLSFYNFGQPQFRDVGKARASYVHTWDMRVYFPAAKYANELGYDGVYLASVAAYAEERLAGSHKSIRRTGIRDLRDYEMRTVADLSDVPKRFSPERWVEFKKDMEYFWRSMGTGGYLGSLRDHGGNATPAWLLFAHGLFKTADATESTFLWTALLDPVLLFMFFVVAWRTFNVQTALFCLVVYGAITFPMFGSNWGGSTLRNDWMVLIGLGVCALHKKRFFLARLLLGCSAMIRAFPVVTLFFLVTPLIHFFVDHWKRGGQLPLFSETLRASRPLLSTAAGALLCAVLLAGASTATFGFDRSWGEWSRKISMHADKPNVNHVGLQTVVTYDPSNDFSALAKLGKPSSDWGPLQVENLKRRSWLYYVLMLLFTGLAVRACRRDNWADAALLGMMIPIYFTLRTITCIAFSSYRCWRRTPDSQLSENASSGWLPYSASFASPNTSAGTSTGITVAI